MNFLKNYGVLLLVIIAFVVLKIPHLNYPFYWDECTPYATAVNRMYLHGPSLMPGAISPEYYRGHPLLFYFLASLWMKIFGASHIAMHSFPLLISVLTLVSVYVVALKLFNRNSAIIAVLLLAFQTAFFVQSSFLLLEILLALLAFLSIYFYATRQFLLTALFLTALLYTKESGIVIGLLLLAHACLSFFLQPKDFRNHLKAFASVVIPFLLIAAFFVLQRMKLGWYIFPFHKNLIQLDKKIILLKYKGCLDFIFRDNLRFAVCMLLEALLLMAWITKKDKNFLYAFLLGILIFVPLWVPPTPWFLLFSISLSCIGILGVTFFAIKQFDYKLQAPQGKLLLLLSFTIVLFAAFTSLNVFILRYLFTALIPVLFIMAVMLSGLISRINIRLFAPVAALLLFLEGYAYYKNNAWGDVDPGAYRGMSVQQNMVSFLEQQNLYSSHIGTISNLSRIQLTDPLAGFLKGNKSFSHVNWEVNEQTEIAIFNNIEPDYQYERVKADSSFQEIYSVSNGNVWGKIFLRRKKNGN